MEIVSVPLQVVPDLVLEHRFSIFGVLAEPWNDFEDVVLAISIVWLQTPAVEGRLVLSEAVFHDADGFILVLAMKVYVLVHFFTRIQLREDSLTRNANVALLLFLKDRNLVQTVGGKFFFAWFLQDEGFVSQSLDLFVSIVFFLSALVVDVWADFVSLLVVLISEFCEELLAPELLSLLFKHLLLLFSFLLVSYHFFKVWLFILAEKVWKCNTNDMVS